MGHVLVAVVVTIVTTLLFRASQRPAGFDRAADAHVLRHSTAFKLVGWVFGIAPAVGILALASLAKSRSDWIALVAMVVFFGGVGAALINEGRAKISLSERGVSAISPWRGQTEIEWGEISSVDYSKLAQWFVIKTRSGKVIRASNYLVGITTLLDYCREYLAANVYSEAERKYRSFVQRAS
jgi:hypothetical protein